MFSGTERVRTMRWFRKARQPDIWEVADDQPPGDIGAAHRIREICASAESIVDAITTAKGRKAERKRAADAARYQAAIKSAIEVATNMSDDAMRDVSLSQIIRLCVKVKHLQTARILVRALRSARTRTELIAEHPELIDQDAAN
jgi:hypothetical protein